MSEHGYIKLFGQERKPCPKCMKDALEENEICVTTHPPIYILRRYCWACRYEERILQDRASFFGGRLEPTQEGEKE